MDIISGLPDDLLVKILLFVPTKVAVSTSIMSKRWEHLWMWLPKLEYSSRNCSTSECERLWCFLDRNMPLHRAPVIETFRLESRFKPENVTMWIVNAISHCVRELDISHYYDKAKRDILPSNVYTCKTLVILKLDGVFFLDVPRMVSLPSLKTLKLQRVGFSSAETLQRLLSNCPVLEDLVVDSRANDTTGKLTIVVPSLLSFSLYLPFDHEIEDGFMIDTPSLKYFKLVDHSDNSHYSLVEHMPNLIEAYVDVEHHEIKSLLRSFSSVKRLAICSLPINDVSFVFNQLEHLEVCPCAVLFSDLFVRLLNASSKLKRLDISFMNGHKPYFMNDWNEPKIVPECLLSNLQSLSWSIYTGKPQEIDILVYILKHAIHLKTATIKSCESDVSKFEMIKELALSSRASTTCQVMFE